MSLTLAAAPEEAPVELARLLAHLRLEPGDDDVQAQSCLDAAVAQFDGENGELGPLVAQSWTEGFRAVPATGGAVELALFPVNSVSEVEVFGADGLWASLPLEQVELFEREGRYFVAADAWGVAGKLREPLRITYVAGYGAPAAVPEPIKHAILLFAAHLYEVREPVSFGAAPAEVPLSIARLVGPYKSWWR